MQLAVHVGPRAAVHPYLEVLPARDPTPRENTFEKALDYVDQQANKQDHRLVLTPNVARALPSLFREKPPGSPAGT